VSRGELSGTMPAGVVHVFGIRHHGPGSARSLERALERLAPDIVLIEGPPEGNALIPLAADPAMRPPVDVLPVVTLTRSQVNGIFLTTVVLMPGLLVLVGTAVWWTRRR